MQSSARNGLGTWLGIAAAVAALATMTLEQLAAVDWTLSWPALIGVLLPILTVMIGKYRQAIEEIRMAGPAPIIDGQGPLPEDAIPLEN